MTSVRRSNTSNKKQKQTRNPVVLVAVVAVIAAVGIAIVHYRSAAPPSPVAAPTPADQGSPGGKVWGRQDAPVTIEVYSDFL